MLSALRSTLEDPSGAATTSGAAREPSAPGDPGLVFYLFVGSGEGDPSDDRGVRRGVRSEGCGGVLPLRAEGGAEGTPTYVRGPTVPLRSPFPP